MRPFSLIIPAYNEYENLTKNIPTLAKRFNTDIVIIENGSDICPDFSYLANVRILHVKKKGLGLALKWGLINAKHSTVVFFPADCSFNLDFIETAVLLVQTGWHLVIGSKAISYRSMIKRPPYRKAVSFVYNWFFDWLYNLKVGDITGVKAYNRDWLLPLFPYCESNGILFEVELIRAMRKRRYKIIEIPVEVDDRKKSSFVPESLTRL